MASNVEICNMALQKLGAKRITSLSEDSVNGRACNLAFEPTKLAELERHAWSFATTRAELAADSAEPAFGRARSFTLPADFVRLLDDYVEDNTLAKDWEIEGKKIYTDDSDPIYIRYVYNVTDPNEMSPLFREALACKMAYQMCEELTQSNSKKAEVQDAYKEAIKEAKKSNAIQKVAQMPPEDPWVTCRE